MEGEKINIFGSNHSQIGSSDLNLILKTAGKIKIQIGRKFIDLIDDKGNINCGYSSIIQKANSVDDIKGTGIFYVGGSIIVSIDNQKITLTTDSGTSYVSFIEKLDILRDLQIIAQKNIGFIYDSLDEINNINSGIIYVESEKSLYIVNEGNLEKYSIEIPNPYPKLFVISKDDNNKGSLLIVGKGIENSVAFDNLFIYNTRDSSNFKSDYPIIFTVNNKSVLEIKDNRLVTNNILSKNANLDYGYRLYFENGESTLEIDNLVVRNGTSSSSTDIDIIPLEYYKNENIILNFRTEIDSNNNKYHNIELKYNSTYNVGDILSLYILKTLLEIEGLSTINYTLQQVKFEVTEILSSKIIKTTLITNFRFDDSSCINKIIGLVDEDLVIGKIELQYNSKEHGIISKQNIFYSVKFDKEGEGILIYPYYSQELYNELSNNIENSNYTYVVPPLGLIKKLQLVHSAEYKRLDKKIYFRDYSGNDLFNIDATDFIKDGMVSNVVIESRIIEGLEVDCLVITFNEDSGQEEIPIPLSKIFDSNLYYTKVEINEIVEDIYDSIPDALVQSDWNETNINNKAYIKNKPDIYTKSEVDEKISEGDSMPLGAIIMWAYSSIPNGWHICDGSTLSGEEYLNFINLYGSTLPDLRGKFVVGRDSTTDFDSLGKTGGEKKHTLTVSEIPSHYHETKDYYHNEVVDNVISYNVSNYDRISTNGKFGAGSSDNDNDAMLYYEHNTKSTGEGNPHENLPPYYTLYYIIKVKGSNDTPVSDCSKYEFMEIAHQFGPTHNIGSAVASSSTNFDALQLDDESDGWINLEATLNAGNMYVYIVRPNDTTAIYREGTAVFKSNDGCIFRTTIRQGDNE